MLVHFLHEIYKGTIPNFFIWSLSNLANGFSVPFMYTLEVHPTFGGSLLGVEGTLGPRREV